MKQHWIERDVTGTIMPIYVSEPAAPARAGVIVLEEIFGVNDKMRAVTDLLAGLGYLAVAPNILHRAEPYFEVPYDADGRAKGFAAACAVDVSDLTADLTATGAYLREQLGDDAKIGTWGFCFGGSVAFLSATLPFVSAAVSFYGGQIARSPIESRPPMIDLAAKVRAPLFFAFGGKDEGIGPDARAKIRKELDARAKPYRFHLYDDEDHAFFREGPDGNAGSRAVWPLVRDFLAEYLR